MTLPYVVLRIFQFILVFLSGGREMGRFCITVNQQIHLVLSMLVQGMPRLINFNFSTQQSKSIKHFQLFLHYYSCENLVLVLTLAFVINRFSNEKSEARNSQSMVPSEVKSTSVYPPEVHDKLIIFMSIFINFVKKNIYMAFGHFFFYVYQE